MTKISKFQEKLVKMRVDAALQARAYFKNAQLPSRRPHPEWLVNLRRPQWGDTEAGYGAFDFELVSEYKYTLNGEEREVVRVVPIRHKHTHDGLVEDEFGNRFDYRAQEVSEENMLVEDIVRDAMGSDGLEEMPRSPVMRHMEQSSDSQQFNQSQAIREMLDNAATNRIVVKCGNRYCDEKYQMRRPEGFLWPTEIKRLLELENAHIGDKGNVLVKTPKGYVYERCETLSPEDVRIISEDLFSIEMRPKLIETQHSVKMDGEMVVYDDPSPVGWNEMKRGTFHEGRKMWYDHRPRGLNTEGRGYPVVESWNGCPKCEQRKGTAVRTGFVNGWTRERNSPEFSYVVWLDVKDRVVHAFVQSKRASDVEGSWLFLEGCVGFHVSVLLERLKKAGSAKHSSFTPGAPIAGREWVAKKKEAEHGKAIQEMLAEYLKAKEE